MEYVHHIDPKILNRLLDMGQLPRSHWRLNGLPIEEAIKDPKFQTEHPELFAKLIACLVHVS